MSKNKSKSPHAMNWEKASKPVSTTLGHVVPKSTATITTSKSKPRQNVNHCVHAFEHQAKEHIHGKVSEVEKENVGTESAHKVERMTEIGVIKSRQIVQKGRQIQKAKSTQHSHAITKRTASRIARNTTKTTATINKSRQNATSKPRQDATTVTSKVWQKQQLKRRMIQTKKAGASTGKATATTGKVGVRVAKLIGVKALLIKAKILLAKVGAKILIVGLKLTIPILLVLLLIGSSTIILNSVVGGVAASMGFQSDELSITNVTRHYSFLDTDFHQRTDDYFALIAYLTATHGSFSYPEISPVLQEIHSQAAGGNLRLTLMNRLNDGDLGQFQILMLTHGEMQFLESPFDFPWLRHITSNFGYRIHPINGEQQIHQGIDIALPAGTPILATHDAVVRFAGEDGGFGLLVELTGENGIMTRYAHNSRNLVSSGQTVRAGDVIAHVGSTGDSTGPHVHFELWRNGQVLNPLFFVETGQSDLLDNMSETLDDVRVAILLAEANRHLGKPYVYGANGPNAFDCSSFVAWVYRESGVYPLQRTTAQGIYNQSITIPYGMQLPGDIVYFHSTYETSDTITHIGIYTGGGVMVHAGSPVQYTSINTPYWQQHFHSFGRLRWN
jgi:murein DD-endopeptidase MepM/ murein hydrolase activator NlpD